MKKLKLIIILLPLFIIICSKSYAVEFQGKFLQGHFILGKTDPNAEIYIDKKKN